jgi:hypothetical protein
VFAFPFDRAARLWLPVLGMTPGTSRVEVVGGQVLIRYGLWRAQVGRLLAHPVVTVTVDRPAELVRLLRPGLLNLLTRVSARTSRVGSRSS